MEVLSNVVRIKQEPDCDETPTTLDQESVLLIKQEPDSDEFTADPVPVPTISEFRTPNFIFDDIHIKQEKDPADTQPNNFAPDHETDVKREQAEKKKQNLKVKFTPRFVSTQCCLCPRKTKTEYAMRNHMKMKHKMCGYCTFKCPDKVVLASHIRKRHDPSFKLPVPNSKPHNKKFFKCLDCDHQARTKKSLKNHIFTAHPTPELNNYFKYQKTKIIYECTRCSKYFRSVNLIEKHILKRHIFADGLQVYSCDHCEYKTVNRRYFRRHVLVHSPPEQIDVFHKCQFCYYRAAQKSLVRKHTEVKHAEALAESDALIPSR